MKLLLVNILLCKEVYKMHSKVIIASLVCMLAASFGNVKVADAFKATQPKTEATACLAPNDRHAEVSVLEDRGDINAGGWFEILIDVPPASPSYNTLSSRDDPDGLLEGFFSRDGKLGITLNIPSTNGDYYSGFSVDGKEVAKVFIFVKDGKASVSPKSKYAARAKYYIDYIATDYDKMALFEISDLIDRPIIQPTLGVRSKVSDNKFEKETVDFKSSLSDLIGGGVIFNPHPEIARKACKADIEKKYNDFVYSDANDIYVGTSKHTASFINGGTDVNVTAYWVDENLEPHLIKDIGVNIYLFGEKFVQQNVVLNPNSSGVDTANFYLPYTKTKNRRMKDFAIEVIAKNKATYVIDGNSIPYTHAYIGEGTSLISAYDEMNFEFYFITNYSDRANAFEIVDAQSVPYNYATDFGKSLPRAITSYPETMTKFEPSNNRIYVRQEHGTNWDVLNHEYGHFMSEKLHLSSYHNWVTPGYRYHDIRENLVSRHGPYVGKKLAYYEGIATYLALASQMYSGRDDVAGVGDYFYSDPVNNVFVNFDNFMGDLYNGVPSSPAYEATVTSLLIKMMDSKSRSGDPMSLGHEAMWSRLLNYVDLEEVIEFFKNDSNLPDYVRNYQLDTLLVSEYSDVTFTGPSRIDTNAAVDSSWTFTIAEDSYLNYCGVYRYDLVFTAERGDDTFVIHNIPLSTRTYTLNRSEINSVLDLNGIKTKVYAKAYSGDRVAFWSSSQVEVTKGGAYELLDHWATYVDMTNRRYRWISIEATQSKTYRVQINGSWSGQAVQLFDRIVLDDESVTPLQTVYGTSNGISFTRSMNRYERMYIRVDNNCYRGSYSYYVQCAPID